MSGRAVYFFAAPDPAAGPFAWLRPCADPGDVRSFPFREQLEIGRYQEGQPPSSDTLLIDDPTISRRHCVLTRTAGGRCFLRDTSRNGTFVDGRRLVPNVEYEIQSESVIGVAQDHLFILVAPIEPGAAGHSDEVEEGTVSCSFANIVTVLVGDIRDYTVMVQKAPVDTLQRSVSGVFEHLEKRVAELGGVVKEYPGDAIFAFWEARDGVSQASRACRAALSLDRFCRDLAKDPAIWPIREFPLMLDWALATGSVVIRSMGGDRPRGLSMVGEPVVLAFRIEKLADDAAGSVLACERTFALIGDGFETRDLGYLGAKGFEKPVRVYSILGERDAHAG